jgi:cytochrome P450
VYKGLSHEDDSALHERYGPLVRLGPNLVSVNSAEELNTIYGISTLFYKSRFYSLAEGFDEEGLIPDPFVTTDKAMHSRLRRGAANAYSLNSMVQLEAFVDPVTERLVNKLKEEYATRKKIVDLGQFVQQYAMDAICALTYGKDLNHIEKGDYLGFFKTSFIINSYMGIVMLNTSKRV